MDNVVYGYLRDPRNFRRVLTVARTRTLCKSGKHAEYHFGFALTNPVDVFVKKTGRQLALQRLQHAPIKSNEVDVSTHWSRTLAQAIIDQGLDLPLPGSGPEDAHHVRYQTALRILDFGMHAAAFDHFRLDTGSRAQLAYAAAPRSSVQRATEYTDVA